MSRKHSHRPFRPHLTSKLHEHQPLIIGIALSLAVASLLSLARTIKPLKTAQLPKEADQLLLDASKQRRTIPAPILSDLGPTGDSSTKIELTNSIPSEMVFTMQQRGQEIQGSELAPCPRCKVYHAKSEVPEDVCDRGTTETFIVAPGEHYVRGSWKRAYLSDMAGTWKLQPGRKYGVCILLDLSRGKKDWDHEDALR
jgi:hypothetical protein